MFDLRFTECLNEKWLKLPLAYLNPLIGSLREGLGLLMGEAVAWKLHICTNAYGARFCHSAAPRCCFFVLVLFSLALGLKRRSRANTARLTTLGRVVKAIE